MSRLDKFEQYVKDAMQSWNCPGVAVAIVKGDEVLYRAAYGLRDIENKLPMTEDTRFAMASVTKSFTAMAIALLVDDGKLEWDKPVCEYMPEFMLNDEYATRHVTVRDMLSHRTGLPRHDLAAWRIDLSLADFIKRMRHFKFSASLREKFQYNNLMYYTSGYLIEKLSNQPWDQFMQQRIFEPLGMIASNFVPEPPRAGQITSLGYRVDRDEQGGAKGLVLMPYGLHTRLSPGTAGALFSTLADLIQWLKVHVNEGQAGETKLISPNNLKQMHLPQSIIPGGGPAEALHGHTIFTYGMGWFVEPYRDYTLVHHGGNVEGHSLIIGCVPQAKVGVVGLTNIAGLPLRDVLLYEGIDRALDLPERDWNTRYHALFDPMIAGMAQGKQTAAQERLEDAPPSHSLDTFVGTYAAEGYPDFAVRKENDKLEACTVGSLGWSELRHYHFNTFEWYLTDFDIWFKVSFVINENGEVDGVSIPIEPEVENVTFKRKPVQLPEDVIAALLGEYVTPIPGLELVVSRQGDKFYVTQTGGTAEESKPYKLDEDLVGLKSKRVRFDFVRDNGSITRMIIKTLDTTLEASRKANA